MTISKADLQALLERVEKAEGPETALDEAIHAALFPDHHFAQLADAPPETGCMMYRWPDGQQCSALRITASIDAVVALIAKAAPHITAWELRSRAGGKRFVADLSHLREGHELQELCYLGRSDSAPLALCAALLRALIAKGGT